jgi:glycosyltransferase involved in cell wall biosynthesis
MVSVIIPVFNRPEFSLRAVGSVLVQTCRDFELVVVDDGSTEEMTAVEAAVINGGGRYYRRANQGVAAARNFGVAQTDGSWIAFLDSDDCWTEEKLRVQSEFLEVHTCYKICQTEEVWFRHGKFVNPRRHHAKPEGDAFSQSLKLCCISPSSVMIARDLFLEHGGFDERMRVCEDYDLWLQVTARHQVGLVREALVHKYGGHADQLSRTTVAMDRYRVYSLAKLSSVDYLSKGQREAVFVEILNKIKVLIAGAEKRNNCRAAELYAEVAQRSTEFLMAGEIGYKNVFADLLDSLIEMQV